MLSAWQSFIKLLLTDVLQGCDFSYTGPQFTDTVNNLHFAFTHPSIIDDILAIECLSNSILGHFDSLSLDIQDWVFFQSMMVAGELAIYY